MFAFRFRPSWSPTREPSAHRSTLSGSVPATRMTSTTLTEAELAQGLAILDGADARGDPVDQSSICWVLTSPTAPYTIASSSDAWCELWGIHAQNAVGKTLDIISGPLSSNAEIGAELRRASSEDKRGVAPAPLEAWTDCGVVTNHMAHSSTPIQHRLVIGPVYGEDESVRFLVGISRPVASIPHSTIVPTSSRSPRGSPFARCVSARVPATTQVPDSSEPLFVQIVASTAAKFALTRASKGEAIALGASTHLGDSHLESEVQLERAPREGTCARGIKRSKGHPLASPIVLTTSPSSGPRSPVRPAWARSPAHEGGDEESSGSEPPTPLRRDRSYAAELHRADSESEHGAAHDELASSTLLGAADVRAILTEACGRRRHSTQPISTRSLPDRSLLPSSPCFASFRRRIGRPPHAPMAPRRELAA